MHKLSNIVFLMMLSIPLILNGQSESRNSIVLINGVANEVELTNSGDILSILREIPGYLPYSGKYKTLKQILDENPQYKIDDVFIPKETLVESSPMIEESKTPINAISKSNNSNIDSGPPVLVEIAGRREVYFDPKNAALNDEAIYKLNDIVTALKESDDRSLQINYTIPLASSLIDLAERRANAIRRYLEIRGVNTDQVKVIGTPGPMIRSVDLILH